MVCNLWISDVYSLTSEQHRGEGVPLVTTSGGRRVREAKLRAETRDNRLAPLRNRMAAFSAGFRPAHETIIWKPADPHTLWMTEEERWEAHCSRLFAARDALIAEEGIEGWIAWQVEARRRRTERHRFQRLQRLSV